MNTLYVWNNENLISLKNFPSYCFYNNTPLKGKFFLPLIRNRIGRFDYDTIGKIITTIKQDPNKNSVHIILLSSIDILPGINQDELFDICSILVENIQNCLNAKVIFLGFFPLPGGLSRQAIKQTRFQGKLRKFIKDFPTIFFSNSTKVQDFVLKIPNAKERFVHVEKFYKEIIFQISHHGLL